MANRTPVHFWYVDSDHDICHGPEKLTPGEVCGAIETLSADNARLREALAECVTDNPGSACYNTGKKTRRLDAINETVRATLAIGGGW